jgi:hypothetical protein
MSSANIQRLRHFLNKGEKFDLLRQYNLEHEHEEQMKRWVRNLVVTPKGRERDHSLHQETAKIAAVAFSVVLRGFAHRTVTYGSTFEIVYYPLFRVEAPNGYFDFYRRHGKAFVVCEYHTKPKMRCL